MTGPPLMTHMPFIDQYQQLLQFQTLGKEGETLNRETRLGVLGNTPIGVSSTWCIVWLWLPKLMVAAKKNCRHPLISYVWEKHLVKPSFIQVRETAANTWKSVTDGWNRYNYVSL